MNVVARLGRTASFLRRVAGEPRLPFRSPEEIRRVGTARLRGTVRFACDRVPRYRALRESLGMRPGDLESVEDLAAWPILEPHDVLRLGNDLVADGRVRPDWVGLHSSGTTGSIKMVYYDPASFVAQLAFRERARSIVARLVGRRTGYREALFVADDAIAVVVEQAAPRLMWAPRFMRVERRVFPLQEDPEAVVSRLTEFRADHFFGVGSYIARVFQPLLEGRASFPLPRAITYTSDEMPAGVRRRIERELAIPVFSWYLAAEGFNLGFECGEGEGLHMNVDLCPFRIVDEEGRTVPPGVTGSIVMSNVMNRGTVLLNYRIGDRGRLLTEPCPCGRTLPRIGGFDGRDDEWVALADGGRMHGQELWVPLVQGVPVWQFRVVQDAVDRFRAFLVLAEEVDRAAVMEGIERRLRKRLGPDAVVEVAFVDEIERTGAGKIRTFESRVGRDREG